MSLKNQHKKTDRPKSLTNNPHYSTIDEWKKYKEYLRKIGQKRKRMKKLEEREDVQEFYQFIESKIPEETKQDIFKERIEFIKDRDATRDNKIAAWEFITQYIRLTCVVKTHKEIYEALVDMGYKISSAKVMTLINKERTNGIFGFNINRIIGNK